MRERLKSKEGRLRGTLMGKRVDFCARSVIGGDPNLDTEQVGVPRSVALNLTFPERVTPLNANWLKELVVNGPTTWPGARYIIRDDGTRIDLRYIGDRKAIELQFGWRVERHMLDGDYVIFNRQPSLHKMSMMGHRAKVMPFSTLRFNLAVTSPYNADFDGDEMNLHLAQSQETRAEIKHMMLNPRQVVSPQGNKPVMGVVQDSLLATAKYTKRDTYMEKDLCMNILMWLPVWDGQLPIPAILKPKMLWTGKQILSMLLPKTLSMKRDAAIASKNKKDEMDFAASDCRVLIVNGELLSGIVCKKTIGSSGGSLLHLVWLDSGPEWCRNVLSYIQKMVNQWLTHNGFSCGVADIIANDQTLLSVEKTLKQAKKEVRALLADAQRGRLETQPGKTMYQSFEAKANQRLNSAREDAGNIGASSLDERNNIISMVNAGSKGSPLNIAQIVACVGQQNVEGARIRYGFNERTLPHFTKDDYGAEARGFVENSYLAGLTPQEVWMHAMGGREGVIDTACKTSETGYIQRRLVKSMETLKVAYDGTSRNACNDIIQFLYGEDGMDGLWIEDQTLDIMTYDNRKLENTFQHKYTDADYGLGWLPTEVLEDIKGSFEHQQLLDKEWDHLKLIKHRICSEVYPDGETKQHIPINISRLLDRARNRITDEDGSEKQERYTPMEIVTKVEELMKQLEVTRAIAEGDTIGREVEDNAKIVLNAHLRCALASRKILEKEKLSKQSFDWLVGEVKQKFMKSLVHPGEVIGTLAAQSVGEPATQMTLNTFHFAGVGAKNVTLGVPRLKELINVAKKVKTPSLAVYLSGDLGQNQERAKDVQSMLEHTTLEKVTSFTQIFWDPDPENTLVEEDQEWVSLYYELPDEDENPARCGPWLLRIQLSNKVMTDKKLTVREVGERILGDFQNDLDCIFTDDNAEELVLRIRLLKAEACHACHDLFLRHRSTMEPVPNSELEYLFGVSAYRQGCASVTEAPGPYDPRDDTEDKNFKFLRTIESNILKEMTLKGIEGIKKVFMREDKVTKYDERTGKFERSQEWVLDTDGVNMEEVMQLEEVDFKRLQSNDIVEILNVLGIEATRKALLFHVRMVISFDGSYVNYRHLGTMCDVMTNRGHLMAITRHGVNRTNMGPLMKASVDSETAVAVAHDREEAVLPQTDSTYQGCQTAKNRACVEICHNKVEILMDAAIYHETDHMRSVSENIIFGQLVPIGTGSFDVHMDDMKTADPEMNHQSLCSLDHATDAWAGKNFAAWFTDEGTDRNTNSLDQKLRQYYAVNTPEPHLEEDEFEDNVQLPELPLTVFENADDYAETPQENEAMIDGLFPTTGGKLRACPQVSPDSPGDLGEGDASGNNTLWRVPFHAGDFAVVVREVVPSDITIVEEKKTIGKRKLMPWESTGLLGMAPMIHLHYSKLDKGDKRKILSRKFDPDDVSEANQICIRRQESVRKEVVATNFMWDTALGMAGLTWWSFRRYNYQSRLVALPFIFYGGTFVGRVIGDIVTGRNAEFSRDRFLGQLPAKVYYNN
ncbi:polr2a [Symbiodinium natans]|uniref:DNA-directed RNA polymerase n=1 Tax=Symbiodinium natans TaxID=878477 RepID=A0A812Q691_9DINO|nr:polr2a [Symbiodinium natans]